MSEVFKITEKQRRWLSIMEIGGGERRWNEERQEYEELDDERELGDRLLGGVSGVLCEGVSNEREYCAKSGGRASVVYGVERLLGGDCYYVLTDDEGRSGYDCCGKIRLYYSYDIEKYLEKCYEINSVDFEVIRKRLNREDYVSKKGRMIDEWVDNVSEERGEFVLSRNESITVELGKPWDWDDLSKNPEITEELLMEKLGKI